MEKSQMCPLTRRTKLAAIFAAGIVGYSRLMVMCDEVGTLARRLQIALRRADRREDR
jgi:hypothetical protein